MQALFEDDSGSMGGGAGGHVVGAFIDGPQEWGTGGQIGLWVSDDDGANWELLRTLTADEAKNHTYPRLVTDAHSDFYAMWASGDAFDQSTSELYFTNADGSMVWRMPTSFEGDFAAPTLVSGIPEPAAGALLGLGGLLLMRRRRRRA